MKIRYRWIWLEGHSRLSDWERMHIRILFPIPLRDRPGLTELDREWLTNHGEYVAEKVADVFRGRGLDTDVVGPFR